VVVLARQLLQERLALHEALTEFERRV
jgi:hypothetical protein